MSEEAIARPAVRDSVSRDMSTLSSLEEQKEHFEEPAVVSETPAPAHEDLLTATVAATKGYALSFSLEDSQSQKSFEEPLAAASTKERHDRFPSLLPLSSAPGESMRLQEINDLSNASQPGGGLPGLATVICDSQPPQQSPDTGGGPAQAHTCLGQWPRAGQEAGLNIAHETVAESLQSREQSQYHRDHDLDIDIVAETPVGLVPVSVSVTEHPEPRLEPESVWADTYGRGRARSPSSLDRWIQAGQEAGARSPLRTSSSEIVDTQCASTWDQFQRNIQARMQNMGKPDDAGVSPLAALGNQHNHAWDEFQRHVQAQLHSVGKADDAVTNDAAPEIYSQWSIDRRGATSEAAEFRSVDHHSTPTTLKHAKRAVRVKRFKKKSTVVQGTRPVDALGLTGLSKKGSSSTTPNGYSDIFNRASPSCASSIMKPEASTADESRLPATQAEDLSLDSGVDSSHDVHGAITSTPVHRVQPAPEEDDRRTATFESDLLRSCKRSFASAALDDEELPNAQPVDLIVSESGHASLEVLEEALPVPPITRSSDEASARKRRKITQPPVPRSDRVKATARMIGGAVVAGVGVFLALAAACPDPIV